METEGRKVCRDMYGFVVRPEHAETYKTFAKIYEVEEEERCVRWESFMKRFSHAWEKASRLNGDAASESKEEQPEFVRINSGISGSMWTSVRSSLKPLEELFKADGEAAFRSISYGRNMDTLSENAQPESTQSDEDSNSMDMTAWANEFGSLVVGGVPMALRGEVWQIFVATYSHRKEGIYEELLIEDSEEEFITEENKEFASSHNGEQEEESFKSQIEKDLQRTFPDHPSLDRVGRDALRRVLIAFAKMNPQVGYCQGMNFLTALLLLLMPEENAFWTLNILVNQYLDGYFTHNMLEAQVDQLVLEDLLRLKFPRLMKHLDSMGAQVRWVTGPWFLTLFVNVLPWDSVLRLWDVLLFQGHRSMLFCTAMALIEVHGPSLMRVSDPGDAMAALQSLAQSCFSFDSTRLIISAAVGYAHVVPVQELNARREVQRPFVEASLRERQKTLDQYKENKQWSGSGSSCKSSPSLSELLEDPKPAKGPREGGGSFMEVAMTAVRKHRAMLVRRQSLKSASRGREVAAVVEKLAAFSPPAEAMSSREGSTGKSDEDLEEQLARMASALSTAQEERQAASKRERDLQVALSDLSTRLARAEEGNHKVAANERFQQGGSREVEDLMELLSETEDARRREGQEWAQQVEQLRQENAKLEASRLALERQVAKQRQVIDILVSRNKRSCEELEAMQKRALLAESTVHAIQASEAKESFSRTLSENQTVSNSAQTRKDARWSRGLDATDSKHLPGPQSKTAESLRQFEERIQVHKASLSRKGEPGRSSSSDRSHERSQERAYDHGLRNSKEVFQHSSAKQRSESEHSKKVVLPPGAVWSKGGGAVPRKERGV